MSLDTILAQEVKQSIEAFMDVNLGARSVDPNEPAPRRLLNLTIKDDEVLPSDVLKTAQTLCSYSYPSWPQYVMHQREQVELAISTWTPTEVTKTSNSLVPQHLMARVFLQTLGPPFSFW